MNEGTLRLIPDLAQPTPRPDCLGFFQAASVLARQDSRLPKPISQALWCGLLDRVLERRSNASRVEDSRVQAPPARRDVLLHAVGNLFSRLDLGAQAAHTVPPLGPSPQGRWLSQVYAAWRQELARHQVATPGDVWREAIALGDCHLPPSWQAIIFDDFPPWPLAARAALMLAQARPVRWRVLHHHGATAWQAQQDKTLRMLERSGSTMNLEIDFDDEADPARAALLDALQDQGPSIQTSLFAPPSRGRLFISQSATVRDEARMALQAWKAFHREHPQARTLLVLANPQRDSLPLRQAAAECGLRLHSLEPQSLNQRPLWRGVDRLRQSVRDARGMEPLAALATLLPASWFPDQAKEDGSPLSFHAWLETLRQQGVRWLPADHPHTSTLESLLAPWRDVQPLSQHLARLEAWLKAQHEDASPSPELQGLSELLKQINTDLPMIAAEMMDGPSALSWLHRITGFLLVEADATARDHAVPLGSLEQAAAKPHDFVAVIGLSKDSLQPSRNGLANNEEFTKRLRHYTQGDVFSAPDGDGHSLHQSWLRLLLRSRALILSSPLQVQGEASVAHPLWETTAKLAETLHLGTSHEDDTLYGLQGWATSALEDDEPRIHHEQSKVIERERRAFFAESEEESRRTKATDTCGALNLSWAASVVRANLKTPLPLSASRLETYAACPFRYYLDYLLGATEDMEPGVLSPLLLGQALHESAERYVRAVQRHGWPLRPEGERLGLLRDTVREELWKVTAYDEVLQREWRHLAIVWSRRLELLFSLEEPPTPRDCEVGFGLPGGSSPGMPALTILRNGEALVTLRGRMDRLDVNPMQSDLCRLVDYKTGKDVTGYKKHLDEEHFGQRWFQAPLYLMAARQMLQGQSKPPARYAFRFALIGNPGKPVEKTWAVGSSYFDEITQLDETSRKAMLAEGVTPFADRIADLAQRILTGRFEISPSDCSYCPYGAVCRVEKPSPSRGKQTEPSPQADEQT